MQLCTCKTFFTRLYDSHHFCAHQIIQRSPAEGGIVILEEITHITIESFHILKEMTQGKKKKKDVKMLCQAHLDADKVAGMLIEPAISNSPAHFIVI